MRVAGIYVLVAALWISFSDTFLEAFTQDEALITRIQTYKGLQFVLTSDRFYRAALPADEALEIIKSQAGRHFDPDVIDVFL